MRSALATLDPAHSEATSPGVSSLADYTPQSRTGARGVLIDISSLEMVDSFIGRMKRLARVNRELEETNRGVVALYAELDERADYLQRANEIRTKFLSNMTHEFRTPLNSITSLTRLLLQKLDGELTSEQEKQVRFIQQSADALSELVNDLLDLAKVEAGKVVIRPVEVRVQDLFGTLRGMLRPLLAQSGSVELIFEEPGDDIPVLHTDESKVSQILRNFISNALKYTERGEVRVSARPGPGKSVTFGVRDTGIGIAEEDQASIFEEYRQVDHPLQSRVKGTGLGLPLARKLAVLLGGGVGVKSCLGEGSTFFATIAVEFKGETDAALVPDVSRVMDPTRLPLLIVEDNTESLFIYETYLKGTHYQVKEALDLAGHVAALAFDAPSGLALARTFRPDVVLCDLGLPGMDGFEVARAMRGDLELCFAFLVGLSGYVSSADVDRCKQAGFNEHMAKPARLDSLEALLAGISKRVDTRG